MDTPQTISHVSLCAGYGGIDLGLKRAIPNLRTIAFSEIEAFACANLVAKMEAGLLDPAPIWTDLKTFPYAKFRGLVDLLSGGYPCQPFSSAGKRLGHEDPRHLWPYIRDGIDAMRPGVCFFENVEGHVTLGLRDVIEDLESLGYRTTWGLFSAAEVGAPHQRKRVFILAYRRSIGSPSWFPRQVAGDEGFAGIIDNCRVVGVGLADSNNTGPQGRDSSVMRECSGELSAWPSRPSEPQFDWEPPRVVGDTLCATGGRNPGTIYPSEEGLGCPGKFARGVTDGPSASGESLGNSSNGGCGGGGLPIRSGEPLKTSIDVAGTGEGVADAEDQRPGETGQLRREGPENRASWGGSFEPTILGQTEPPMGRVPYGRSYRVDELRLLGNGVVPATAERAFRVLAQRLISKP